MPAFETVRLQCIATVLMASERLQHPMTVEQRKQLIDTLGQTYTMYRSAAGEKAGRDADAILINSQYVAAHEIITLEGHLAPRAFETVALAMAREEPNSRVLVLLSLVIQNLTEEQPHE